MPSAPVNIACLLRDIEHQLAAAGVPDTRVEATLLLQEMLSLSRSQLFLYGDRPVTSEQQERVRTALARRCRREPLHYILGSREFWGRQFFVSPAVLIPRPETEFLLEHVLATLRTHNFFCQHALDMCTGSGVIAVILAHELKTRVTAVDRSVEALHVAAQNIVLNSVQENVQLVCADLFSALQISSRVDLIVSNPPYIAEEVIELLDPEVREWEPRLALTAGKKGLDIIEQIALQAADYLRPGGWIFLEIGADQRSAVLDIFNAVSHTYIDVDVCSDWAGRPRVLQARRI